jgi:hypothetical protein
MSFDLLVSADPMEKKDRNLIPMPYTQSTAQKLASRMVKVDPSIEKTMKVFSENAVFIFPPDRLKREEFIEKFRTGNQQNVTKIGQWTNTFEAKSADSTDIIWDVNGYQFRLGNGMMENGPGWYHMKQKILLKFTQENGKTKISEWYSMEYTKTKLET